MHNGVFDKVRVGSGSEDERGARSAGVRLGVVVD